MAIKLGDALMVIGADIKPLERSMNAAKGIVKGTANAISGSLKLIGKGVVGAAKGIAKFAAGVVKAFRKALGVVVKFGKKLAKVMLAGGAAVVAFVGLSLKHFISLGDSLQKMSIRLGIATQDLEFLKFAAERSGLEFGTLTNSIQIMQRGISEAAEGTGTAKDALEALGITAESLKKRTPLEQFQLLVEALGNVENQAEKMQAAFDIFGRGGGGLIQFAEGGRDAMSQLIEDFNRLGGGLGQAAADKAAAVADQMTNTKQALSNLTSFVGEFAAPVFQDFLKKNEERFIAIREFIDENKEAIVRWRDELTDFLSGGGAQIKDFVDTAKQHLRFLINADDPQNLWKRIKILANNAWVAVRGATDGGGFLGLVSDMRAKFTVLVDDLKIKVRGWVASAKQDFEDLVAFLDLLILGENGWIGVARERLRLEWFRLQDWWADTAQPWLIARGEDFRKFMVETVGRAVGEALAEGAAIFNSFIQSNPDLARLFLGLDALRGTLADTSRRFGGPVGGVIGNVLGGGATTQARDRRVRGDNSETAPNVSLNVRIDGSQNPEEIWGFLKPRIIDAIHNPPSRGIAEAQGLI